MDLNLGPLGTPEVQGSNPWGTPYAPYAVKFCQSSVRKSPRRTIASTSPSMNNTRGLSRIRRTILMKRFTSILVEASVDLFLKIVKLVAVERNAHRYAFFRLNDQLVKTLTAFPVHTFDCDAHFTAPSHSRRTGHAARSYRWRACFASLMALAISRLTVTNSPIDNPSTSNNCPRMFARTWKR